MWETQHNNADLDCFKTLILHDTLKTQNQHQENSVYFRKSHVCASKLDVQEDNGEEKTRATKRENMCVQVAICSDESIFSHSDKFLFRVKSEWFVKVRGCRLRWANPIAGWKSQFIRRSVDFSSAIAGCIFGGMMEKQRRNHSHKEEKDSEDFDNLEAEIWFYKGKQVTGRPIAQNNKAWVQPFVHEASSSVDKSKRHRSDVEAVTTKIATHIPVYGIWMWTWLFGDSSRCHSSSGNHLGQDYDANLRYGKIFLWRIAGTVFSGMSETSGWSVIDFQDLRLMSTSLLHSRVCQYSIAKAYVFSDSVWERWGTILLNLGGAKFNGVRNTIISKIWIELMDIFWNLSGRFSWDSLQWMGIFKQIQQMMRELRCEPENFTGRIIFMSKSNDMVWDSKGMMKYVETI